MQRFAMRMDLRAPIKRGRISLVAVIAAAALIGSAAGQQVLAQNSAPATRTLVRAGHLLDVRTGKTLDAQTIVVTGDRITAIAATSATPAQAGDKVIDLGGMTVLPGLIDVHTHLTMNPVFDPYLELTETNAKDAINGVVNARTTLMAGLYDGAQRRQTLRDLLT